MLKSATRYCTKEHKFEAGAVSRQLLARSQQEKYAGLSLTPGSRLLFPPFVLSSQNGRQNMTILMPSIRINPEDRRFLRALRVSVVNPILSARAHIMEQNARPFCRARGAILSGNHSSVARSSAHFERIMSPLSVFSRSAQIATNEPATTYEVVLAHSESNTQILRDPRTSTGGVFSQYETKRTGRQRAISPQLSAVGPQPAPVCQHRAASIKPFWPSALCSPPSALRCLPHLSPLPAPCPLLSTSVNLCHLGCR